MTCEKCTKKFTSKKLFCEHIDYCQSIVKHRCYECGKCFYTVETLMEHMKRNQMVRKLIYLKKYYDNLKF